MTDEIYLHTSVSKSNRRSSVLAFIYHLSIMSDPHMLFLASRPFPEWVRLDDQASEEDQASVDHR